MILVERCFKVAAMSTHADYFRRAMIERHDGRRQARRFSRVFSKIGALSGHLRKALIFEMLPFSIRCTLRPQFIVDGIGRRSCLLRLFISGYIDSRELHFCYYRTTRHTDYQHSGHQAGGSILPLDDSIMSSPLKRRAASRPRISPISPKCCPNITMLTPCR